ncbi:3-keto-5-aminohexanoate cleavage protein [Sphingomonas bacterium]|uniref:3-keto-5-aminohexanoate cleavage protein n=1 Tax=Sphingomonas bacterium TaxID=1895847 RepID=UPI0015770E22|nr:3-keto-5-aminohexanoate cleavage protein [Sphingomonas bacterium]
MRLPDRKRIAPLAPHGDGDESFVMQPVIIEMVPNGETRVERNPATPRAPAAIARELLALTDQGASLIHNHIDDFRLTGEAAAERYGEGWAPLLARHPDAILCPTTAAGSSDAAKIAHFAPCAERGARMAPLDPGSMNMPISGGGAECARMLSYINDFTRIAMVLDTISRAGLAASIGIYEPGFLRATIAFQRAGKLPPGSFVKFYFFGGRNYYDGTPCIGFGLDPTPAALDAYLDILGDSGLPWAAAVIGGDVFASGMAKLAIARGGGVRVGLEDFGGDRTPTNATLLGEVVALCREAGRPPASAREAAAILGLR